ncbi:MFS general substrate transporter [Aspergillus ibericus CBS 121593]|uniref:MFS general substrate transporter n=1 Tax=Aspergillus ibericus CBS 121593 TaxID=1448316 RepID=A0A395GQZ0_9EURO|nr:MFS general substrate transporter [Aspergillus ibericus CBS 121593]RAK96483.1 MFS general substrate transporter [Aspergillus ibericus CBS 121593]
MRDEKPQLDSSSNSPAESEKSPVSSRTEPDVVVVDWDGPNDPEYPRNWSNGRKWLNVLLISLQGTLSPIASTILTLGVFDIAIEFHLTSPYTPVLPIAFYLVGLALGPLGVAPCSEIFGRRPVYTICFAIFTLLNVGCALVHNMPGLVILRFLAGVAGSAGPSLGGSSIGDLFSHEERGKAQAVYGLGPICGPVLGGVVGGFIAYGTNGWRWMLWVVTIAAGVVTGLAVAFQKETYAPVLLQRRKRALEKANPGTVYWVEGESDATKVFRQSIFRPLRLLFFSPICTFMSLYLALVFGLLYLHMVTITLLFSSHPEYGLYSYHWTHGTTGLGFLGAGLGAFAGVAFCMKYSNPSYRYFASRYAQQTGVATRMPEFRLPFMQVGMLIVPIGLVIFGWTAEYHVHWIVTLLGAGILGLGMVTAYICVQSYLVDAFEEYAASALAAAVVARFLVAAVFSVVGFQLYKALGYGWGSTLLALICLAAVPIPFLLGRYGPRLRGIGTGGMV